MTRPGKGNRTEKRYKGGAPRRTVIIDKEMARGLRHVTPDVDLAVLVHVLLAQYLKTKKRGKPMVTREQENQLILDLCHEVGDVGSDEELIEGFRSNYPDSVIADAANGDVQALIQLREGCGLPIFR